MGRHRKSEVVVIENYAFFVMFAVQIVAMSVIFPARFVRYVRAKVAEYPAETFAQVYPGEDPYLATERLLRRFRLAHAFIAMCGFALLAWMAANAPPLTGVKLMIYPVMLMILQSTPMILVAVTGLRQVALLRSMIVERKRRAVLQPRGLFDLISPLRVAVEVSIFFAFVAFVLYLVHGAADPFPASAGYSMIGAASLGMVLQAFYLYWRLRGKKIPLESQAERMQTTGAQARNSVYGTLLTVVFMSLVILMPRSGLQDWLLFALSAFLTLMAFHFCLSVQLPPRDSGTDEPDSHLATSEKSS
jgi:hypothetical protein